MLGSLWECPIEPIHSSQANHKPIPHDVWEATISSSVARVTQQRRGVANRRTVDGVDRDGGATTWL